MILAYRKGKVFGEALGRRVLLTDRDAQDGTGYLSILMRHKELHRNLGTKPKTTNCKDRITIRRTPGFSAASQSHPILSRAAHRNPGIPMQQDLELAGKPVSAGHRQANGKKLRLHTVSRPTKDSAYPSLCSNWFA